MVTKASALLGSKRRFVSHEELRTLFNCEAQWDFRYSDRLAGSSLKPREEDVERLISGSIWDEIVKVYNRTGVITTDKAAMETLHGKPIDHTEYEKQLALLRRYASNNRWIGTYPVEEFRVAISPILDLWVSPDDLYDDDGLWYIDYKLRASLTSLEYLQRNFQGLLYVWGGRRAGHDIQGIIFDETLNEMPAEVRYNKDGRPSKVQTCSASDYLKGCVSGGYLPDPEVLKKLEERKVHQRVMIQHFDFDMDSLEATILSAYSRITYLERNILYPTRVRNPMICRNCKYNSICEFPDPDYIDFLYHRKPAKRDR